MPPNINPIVSNKATPPADNKNNPFCHPINITRIARYETEILHAPIKKNLISTYAIAIPTLKLLKKDRKSVV